MCSYVNKTLLRNSKENFKTLKFPFIFIKVAKFVFDDIFVIAFS